MSQIVLGKVAFVDKGVYATASTYNTFDFVVTDDSCYLCVKDGNKNHPLTDTAWWKCIARGTQATEAARTALAEANKALEATRNALSAAGLANATRGRRRDRPTWPVKPPMMPLPPQSMPRP